MILASFYLSLLNIIDLQTRHILVIESSPKAILDMLERLQQNICFCWFVFNSELYNEFNTNQPQAYQLSRLRRIVTCIGLNQKNQPILDLYLVRRYKICHFPIVVRGLPFMMSVLRGEGVS